MQMLSLAERRSWRSMRTPWWGIPTRNTLDRATAMLPELMHERLDQIGIDVAIPVPDLRARRDPSRRRRAPARAVARVQQLRRGGVRGRIAIASCPSRAFRRTRPRRPSPSSRRGAGSWVSRRGHDGRRHSAPDSRGQTAGRTMDRRARSRVALRLLAAVGQVRRARRIADVPFDRSRLGDRARRRRNYVFNHIGNFAAAGEFTRGGRCSSAACRCDSPQLRFAFLEGGAAWACNSASDVLGHWEKRNVDAIGNYDPSALDREATRKPVRSSTRRRGPRAARPARRRADHAVGAVHRRRRARRVRGVAGSSGRRRASGSSPSSTSSGAKPTTRWRRSRSYHGLNPFGAQLPAMFAERHRPLGRSRLRAGVVGSVGAGRARAPRRGRVQGVHLRQSGRAVVRARIRTSSRARSSRVRSRPSGAGNGFRPRAVA